MELEKTISELENSKGNLSSRVNQAKDRMSRLGEGDSWPNKQGIWKNMLNTGKGYTVNVGHNEKLKSSSYMHRWRRRIPS